VIRLRSTPQSRAGLLRLSYDHKKLNCVSDLSQGVKEVIVFDPTSLLVLHAHRDGTMRKVSPEIIECGCIVTV